MSNIETARPPDPDEPTDENVALREVRDGARVALLAQVYELIASQVANRAVLADQTEQALALLRLIMTDEGPELGRQLTDLQLSTSIRMQTAIATMGEGSVRHTDTFLRDHEMRRKSVLWWVTERGKIEAGLHAPTPAEIAVYGR